MADVTGPISSLPGAAHAVPEGIPCDQHPNRPAVARIQGETDSMGCEMHDLCDECVATWAKEAREADTSGRCDWCKEHAPKLRHRRDYEEGMSGPVYRVCQPCIDRVNARDEAELAARDDGYWDYDEPDDYDPQYQCDTCCDDPNECTCTEEA